MNQSIKSLLIFIGGCAIGAASTFFGMRKYYEEREERAIESMREALRNREETPIDSKPVMPEPEYDPLAKTSANQQFVAENLVKQYKYMENEIFSPHPEIISSAEFGDNPDYDLETLTYYDDGVLCDDRDYPIENPTELVGDDYMSRFTPEDGTVFVRNDVERKYYEILYSLKTFDEVKNERSYLQDIGEVNGTT